MQVSHADTHDYFILYVLLALRKCHCIKWLRSYKCDMGSSGDWHKYVKTVGGRVLHVTPSHAARYDAVIQRSSCNTVQGMRRALYIVLFQVHPLPHRRPVALWMPQYSLNC